MNARQELCESLRDWLLALALAGSLLLCCGSACADAAESAEAMEVDAEAVQEAPDGAAARRSLEAQRQQRQALREAQRQARSERLEAQMQRGARTVAPLRTAAAAPSAVVAASPSAAVAAAVAVAEPAATPIAAPQVDIVFRRDEAWGPDFASVREGAVVVEARALGRDAAGQAVDVDPAWEAADPAAVAVSPALGATVTITVLAPGESNLTVAGPGYSRDLWISATAQGKVMQVRISQ